MDSGTLSPPTATRPWRFPPRISIRRIDKLICLAASYFPLLFVYSSTTWAVYTEAYSICWRTVGGLYGVLWGTIGFTLYLLAMWSYTYAVFKNPGTPLGSKHGYSHLPTTEPSYNAAITTKGNGQDRYCKKCQCKKPDRTHHCSSCRTCVLKMDHHCPWLANCLGLYNYKAFLLFLIYTSLLCIVSFAVSFHIVYTEVFAEVDPAHPRPTYPSGEFGADLTPVNWILLIVVSGVIGLVLSGFTIWHIILTSKNMTTIESLEKVRYTAPSLRTGAPPAGAQLVGDSYSNTHAERQHEINRYNNYILEESSKKLPHAFNLGRAHNFAAVFGSREDWIKWPFPMHSGVSDGWNWETSAEWRDAVEVVKLERDRRLQDQSERERAAGWGYDATEERSWNNNPNPEGLVKYAGGSKGSLSKAEVMLGKAPKYRDIDSVPLRNLKPNRPTGLHDDISSDDEEEGEGGMDGFEDVDVANPPRRSRNEWGAWD